MGNKEQEEAAYTDSLNIVSDFTEERDWKEAGITGIQEEGWFSKDVEEVCIFPPCVGT